MLYEFLGEYKKEITQLCKEKILADGQLKPTSALLDQGLPIFYEELIGVLQRTASAANTQDKDFLSENRIKDGNAAQHGKESLRLGYTISQVVHSYGAVCQSITEFVQTKSFKITSREFQDLNFSLDCAIAEAVTEFEKTKIDNINDRDVEQTGFLIHEMGNTLTAASLAHEMIQSGSVGSSGSTSKVLTTCHEHMWRLIRSAQMEIRMRGHTEFERTRVRLMDITNEVETTTLIIAKSKGIQLKFDVDPVIQLTTDRYLIFCALSNLVNNAMKFTKKRGNVWVRGKELKGKIIIEVEDECGGLPEGKMEEMFKPFVQKGFDKTGMGLGLSLSRRAVEFSQGKLTVRDIPGKGCIFVIELPKN